MIFAVFSVTIEKVTVPRSPDKGVALPSTTCVVPSSGLAGKINRFPRLEPPNEILGCAQNQSTCLVLKKIGPYLELIVPHIISTPTLKRADDQGSFSQVDWSGAGVNKQFTRDWV